MMEGGLTPELEIRREKIADEDEPPQDHPTLPPSFGDYELLEEIARGGMGVVYKARQRSLNRLVAVKMILTGRLAKAAELHRFRAEAETAARLQHPNIVAIHEVGSYDGQPFFSMDYVEGQNLAELARTEPLPARRAAAYLKTIADAVHYAHSLGVLHRDLKPSNILIDQNDRPRITDFGLAKRLDDSQLSTPDPHLTLTGQVLGSPNFMPPEQAAGQRGAVGPASDVYSMGAILYQLLTGRPPFMAETLTQTLRMVAETEPATPRLLNPAVPQDLETISLKCLQKEAQRRYATAQELEEDLDRFLRDEPIRARPVGQAERFVRWCRRNQALATTGAAVALLLLGLAIGSPIAAFSINRERHRAEASARNEEQQRRRAEENAGKAEQAAKLEVEQRARAVQLAEENRRNLYAARIKLAEQTIKEGDTTRVMQLLESLVPTKDQEDLRSFDWYYLWRLCRSELFTAAADGRVRAVSFSPDGKFIAIGGDDRKIRVLTASNGVERIQLTGHTGPVAALAFSPDGRMLASGGWDARVRLWDWEKGNALGNLSAGTNAIVALAFSPDTTELAAGEGEAAASGSNPSTRYASPASSGRVLIWNLGTRQIAHANKGHAGGARCLAFSPDGLWLASGGYDRRVNLYATPTGQTVAVQTNFPGPVFGMVFSPSGRELSAASWFSHEDSGQIRILNAVTLEDKRTLTSNAGEVLCLAISPDGTKLASAGADRIARVWDFARGAELAAYHGHSDVISALAFAPDGRTLVTAGWDKLVKVWGVETNPARQRIPTENAFSVAFSPDGKLLACSGRQVEVREAGSGNLVQTLAAYTNYDVRVAFTPDGSVLAATGLDGLIHFWETGSWRHWTALQLEPYSSTNEYAGMLNSDCRWAFSPDSRTLAMPLDDKTVRFWDVKSGAMLAQITGLTRVAYAVAFTPDGQTLITGGLDSIGFWDVATKRLKTSIREGASLLRVSRDGRWLTASQFRVPLKLFDLRDRPGLPSNTDLPGHKDMVWSLALSSDNRLLASASWDGTVRIWHLLSGQELLTIPSLAGVVWSVAFAPDSRAVAFGSGSTIPGSGVVTVLRAASETDPTFVATLAAANAVVLRNAGNASARAGRWKEGLRDFSEALELDPQGESCWYGVAGLLLQTGDLAGYRRHCQRMLTRFVSTADAGVARRAAKACLLLPLPPADWPAVQRLAETGVKPSSQWGEMSKGFAEYRQGRFASAIEWMKKPLANPVAGRRDADVQAWAVMGMAYYQLSRLQEARNALAKAVEVADKQMPKLASGDLGENWLDWIIANGLINEAKTLIEGTEHADRDAFRAKE